MRTFRGHPVYQKGENFYYSDDNSLTTEGYMKRPCGICNKMPTKEGHDPCIGHLDDVKNACCGHGVVKDAYVQLDHPNYEEEPNKIVFRGEEALHWMGLK